MAPKLLTLYVFVCDIDGRMFRILLMYVNNQYKDFVKLDVTVILAYFHIHINIANLLNK